MDYDARCAAATSAQGLDPILSALEAAEVSHLLQQTGGFCMVVMVPRTEGMWGVIDDEGTLTACWYPGTAWTDGEPETLAKQPKTIKALVELVKTAPVV